MKLPTIRGWRDLCDVVAENRVLEFFPNADRAAVERLLSFVGK